MVASMFDRQVDTHHQTHSLADVPQYAMKPRGDFLSLNDHEGHPKLAREL